MFCEPELLLKNKIVSGKTSDILNSWLEEIMHDSENENSTKSQDITMQPFTINNAEQSLLFVKDLAENGIFKLDLAAMNEIDTVGIQLLLALQKKAAQNDTKLSLSNVSEEVSEALTFYNLKDRFLIN